MTFYELLIRTGHWVSKIDVETDEKLHNGFSFVFDWLFGSDSKFKPVDPSKVKRLRRYEL